MNKLRLHPEDLRVESFAPAGEGGRARGTVRAHATGYYTCDPNVWTCPECAYPDTESCPNPCTGACGGGSGGGGTTVGGTQTRTDV